MSKESNACKIILLWSRHFNRQFRTKFDPQLIESFQRYISKYGKLTICQRRALGNIWDKFEIARWARNRGMSL